MILTSPPLDSIITGDCIEVLSQLPAGSVDLVFADPPYNLQLSQDLYRPNMTLVNPVDDPWDKFSSFEEYDQFTRAWLLGCRRVLKNSGTIWVIGSYHNIYRVGSIMQDLDFWLLNDVVWIKNNPMPNFRGMRFTNAHETLLWAQKKRGVKYTFNYHSLKAMNDDLQMRSDWYMPLCTGRERLKLDGGKLHTTQKPEALLYRILLASTNPADVVLDPFFGTGTTGAVARKLGRHFIGIERHSEYTLQAEARIAAVEPAPVSTLTISDPPHRKRVPFVSLLEAGLLVPGQLLYFTGNALPATIMVDGTLSCGELKGSIHSVARTLLNMPANGWNCWLYENAEGKKLSINTLREKILIGESS